MPAVLARGRWPFPKPRRPVLGGWGFPGVGVWHWGMHTPHTGSTPPRGWCPGPVVRGFAPGTLPMGRAGEHSGCGVAWRGVVWRGMACGVVFCSPVPGSVAFRCVVVMILVLVLALA